MERMVGRTIGFPQMADTQPGTSSVSDWRGANRRSERPAGAVAVRSEERRLRGGHLVG